MNVGQSSPDQMVVSVRYEPKKNKWTVLDATKILDLFCYGASDSKTAGGDILSLTNYLMGPLLTLLTHYKISNNGISKIGLYWLKYGMEVKHYHQSPK